MCGIAGILDFTQYPTKEDILPMVQSMVHRGPNDEGYYCKDHIAMGMRRLSIIDVTHGHQPIESENGKSVIIFNGEIYNYIELKKELEKDGVQFKTQSDTEVIINLYQKYGKDLLHKLNGMFSIAIWEKEKKELFIARDRIGIKPLYFFQKDNFFSFASEIKSLKHHSKIPFSLNKSSFGAYFELGYFPKESTPYKGIYKLLPGHYIVLNKKDLVVKKWWDSEQNTSVKTSNEPSAEELKALLSDAVKLRMRSDVPVGSFLSGGLDSSLISAIANKTSDRPLHTYNVSFSNSAFDETPFAEEAANHCKTYHKSLCVNESDALSILPKLIWQLDEPIADSAIIPNYFVSRMAAQDVTVCLSGLGGDELFGGYSRYLPDKKGKIEQLFSVAPWIAQLIAPAFTSWKPEWRDQLKITSTSSQWLKYYKKLAIFDADALNNSSAVPLGSSKRIIENLWNNYSGNDPIGQKQFIDQHLYLPNQLLNLTDKISMATSLEVRVPFLDHRIIEFASHIPHYLKQNEKEFKIFLKSTFSNKLPKSIINRPKWGFDAPFANWLTSDEFFPLLKNISRNLKTIIDPQFVDDLTKDKETVFNQSRRVWSLLTLSIWLAVHENKESPLESLNDLYA